MSSLVCVTDYEIKASTLLDKKVLDYYKGGAGDEYTLKLNREAFQKLRIRPRCLIDVSNINVECEIFGETVNWPLGISPCAMQKMAHPIGELGNAKAAGIYGSIFVLSTMSNTSIEELAEMTPQTIKWFQLYIYKDRTLSENLIRRAEAAGFKALVLTVDASVYSSRRADMRNQFRLPSNLSFANFTGVQAGSTHFFNESSGISDYVSKQFDSSLTWKDIEWLIRLTKLPVILKGILTKEDALLAVQYGCSGIIVSNHGARVLDGAPASIEVLPEIVAAVGHKTTIMMDGGITQGTDIFKALALGAKMVFMGRPALWGLAVNGQKGVENILSLLKKDFEITMALAGCPKLSDIRRDMVVHENSYSKL